MEGVSPQRDRFREELFSEQRAPSFSAQEAAALFARVGIHGRNYPTDEVADGVGFQHNGVFPRLEPLGFFQRRHFSIAVLATAAPSISSMRTAGCEAHPELDP